MNKLKSHIIIHYAILLILSIAIGSCGSKKGVVSRQSSSVEHSKTETHQGNSVQKAISIPQEWQTLDIELDKNDNRKLYQELKCWLGVPYLYGGNTKNGVDCSGLIVQIYKKIYHINLQRNSAKIFEKNCRSISVDNLKEGDLVFFATAKNSDAITHVGIYLKDHKFVHASSSRGVVVNDMRQNYYRKHFAAAGRVL